MADIPRKIQSDKTPNQVAATLASLMTHQETGGQCQAALREASAEKRHLQESLQLLSWDAEGCMGARGNLLCGRKNIRNLEREGS